MRSLVSMVVAALCAALLIVPIIGCHTKTESTAGTGAKEGSSTDKRNKGGNVMPKPPD